MDFDYYFKKYDEEYGFNDSELCGFRIGFEAGQQSKQEEVNKLQEEMGASQKRINEALELINNQHDTSTIKFVRYAINKILKGEYQ